MTDAYPSTRNIDEASVDAAPAFTEFGDSAAGFCGADVCAIPSSALSGEPDLTADTGLSMTGH